MRVIGRAQYRSSHLKRLKKVFLKISQNSQVYTYARVSFLIKLQVQASGMQLFKNNFLYRTPPVAASSSNHFLFLRLIRQTCIQYLLGPYIGQ